MCIGDIVELDCDVRSSISVFSLSNSSFESSWESRREPINRGDDPADSAKLFRADDDRPISNWFKSSEKEMFVVKILLGLDLSCVLLSKYQYDLEYEVAH